MTLKERIDLLAKLGEELTQVDEALETAIRKTYHNNKWLTIENSKQSIEAIRVNFLQKNLLEDWVKEYDISDALDAKKIGLILAGNIPLVGFHDVLSVFISGHQSLIKLSDKAPFLLPCLLQKMEAIDPRSKAFFQIIERLVKPDAVIATGSNNSARYFEAYFGKYPHIIRQNRNAVSVIHGDETPEELLKLGDDVFQYFGLGCRNVSKLYVPENYNFNSLLEAFHEFREIVLHDKYKNNFDYNYTLVILNKIEYKSNGCVLMIEEESIASRIANLHFEYYKNEEALIEILAAKKTEIQCIVSSKPLGELVVMPLGMAQKPRLNDYADGVDTLAFLTSL